MSLSARVLLEANGHEVGVRELPEPTPAGNKWETSCTCGTPLGVHETHDKADEEAADHAERYHGKVKAAEVTT